jgi:hypothetical protein
MLARTNRLAPDAIRQWMQMPGAFELLGSKLMGLNTKEAFDRTMDFVVRMPRMDQRRRLWRCSACRRSRELHQRDARRSAPRAEEEFTKSHPFATATAARADENFTKLRPLVSRPEGRSRRSVRPHGAAGVEAINHFFENGENVREDQQDV